MSIKCNMCSTKVFDSVAYLKMCRIEREIESKMEEHKSTGDKEGIREYREQLSLVQKCKNCL